MKRKGFTLVELLVVIAIIAVLLSILGPALGKVKAIAYRMMCGSNIHGLGKAIFVYAQVFNSQYPVAGGPHSRWDSSTAGFSGDDWQADTAAEAYGYDPTSTISSSNAGAATATASPFLLIKFADAQPEQFICKADREGVSIFKSLDFYNGNKLGFEDWDAWDFGPDPENHVSYSFYMANFLTLSYAGKPGNVNMTVSPGLDAGPDLALIADRNPFIAIDSTNNMKMADNDESFWIDFDNPKKKRIKNGNAVAHGQRGQNVLFNDGHVFFEEQSNCGLNSDNIYTSWGGSDPQGDWNVGDPRPSKIEREMGNVPRLWSDVPRTSDDSMLVSEQAPAANVQ